MHPPLPPDDDDDDRQLLTRFQKAGDQAAFTRLVGRYLPLVYTVALRVVQQPPLAEEVAQDVFLKLARRPPALTMKTPAPLAAWLHHLTRCRAIDLLRSERRRTVRESRAALDVTLSPDAFAAPAALLDAHALELLDEVLDRLPQADRTLILGRYYMGHSLAALSAQAGCSQDALRMRLGRALEKLRHGYARHGIATTAAVLAQALPAQAVAPPAGAAAATLAQSISASAAASLGAAATTVAVAGGGVFTLSRLLSLITMTTTQKFTIAGAVLLAAAIPTALYINHSHGQPANAPAPQANAGGPGAGATASPVPTAAPARTGARKDLDGPFAALAETYGAAQTRQAQALASRSVTLLRDIAVSPTVKQQQAAQTQGQTESLGKALSLTPEENAALRDMQTDLIALRQQELTDLPARVEKNLPGLAEVFLAVDAHARDRMDDAAYTALVQKKLGDLRSGGGTVLEYLGLIGMKAVYQAEDPFAGLPDQAAAFAARLSPDHRQAYEELRRQNDSMSQQSPEINRKDLDGLTNDVNGMAKMIEAMQLMNDGQAPKQK